jgi:nitrate/nitrite transporter NarK
VLVAADLTRGGGRSNLVQQQLAMEVAIGAALSTTLGGKLADRFDLSISSLGSGLVAAVPLVLLVVSSPETLHRNPGLPFETA